MNHYAVIKICAAHPCPHCDAHEGQSCKTSTGNPCPPHILRINMAKRAAVRGAESSVPCPAGCGDALRLEGTWVKHVRTGVFECDPAGGYS